MCGLFGIFKGSEGAYSEKILRNVLRRIALASESRGKDSSGIVLRDATNGSLNVVKGDVPISFLLGQPGYRAFLDAGFPAEAGRGAEPAAPFAAMGHARLVTNGSQLRDENNQPVIKDGVVAIHNGIIVNADRLWETNSDLRRAYEIDTEVLLALCRSYLQEGDSLPAAVARCVQASCGTVSTAMLFNDRDQAVLATNNGSLYILSNDKDILIFASEGSFLKTLAIRMSLQKIIGPFSISQVKPGTGYVIDLLPFKISSFDFEDPRSSGVRSSVRSPALPIGEAHVTGRLPQREVILEIEKLRSLPKAASEEAMLENNAERVKALKRCRRCILPETFPFIEFDESGLCNYCRNHKPKNEPKPLSQLFELVERYRGRGNHPDCLVPFSGGRDSTFTLHMVKNVLKLNPIAFTYDWGMVTDLGRRNIARVCGKLGVENILISADIHWKRRNIRRNIQAWLKNPALGMVPLFMAGDKFFFYYCHQVKMQAGIQLNIWGINPLENTEFKVGFCGISPDFEKERIYSLSKLRQMKLLGFVGKNFLRSPGYLNPSLGDSFGSFLSRYFAPKRDYYHFYDYYRWDEREIEDLILNEYDWEVAVDTRTTWRIGDGTAAFYNYIYYTVAGFSEYDTFRSNQIREGALAREQALALVETENRPRYPSIKWYLEVVGLDYENAIRRINRIPKLYA